jgi:diguanylate cyclase (GGDEF)-like protein
LIFLGEPLKNKLNNTIKSLQKEINALGNKMNVSRFLKLQKELEKFLITDSLTGALNRWKFEEILDGYIKRDEPVYLMMIDIDKFKRLNDSKGHNKGDAILKKLVMQIKKEDKGECNIGRWGGDEFLYVSPFKNLKDTEEIAENIRKSLNKQSIKVSIGVTRYNGKDNRLSFIDKADRAMYKAKYQGGNKVEYYEM